MPCDIGVQIRHKYMKNYEHSSSNYEDCWEIEEENFDEDEIEFETAAAARRSSFGNWGELAVLADGHVAWACEAFSKLHGQELIKSPALFWCWRLFMVKLWNHGLLDACAMNNCNMILERCQNEGSEAKEN
ncbi:Polycomb protein, VEFS-Box [Corchorus olitorius]|uniref:Polycomb protein, VEFS-Box n=1 Tax=Corchorus olitorius TaxID=93759 RepID=A0A1R3G3E7_9ROSI|nr:Polycomb protein, VEFS-Box [Corchorus olitorius]